jgi:CheY-like chemotaxis protein
MVIALTRWGQDADRLRSKRAGFDAHLVKPVDCDQLLGLLERTSGSDLP